MNFSDRKQQLLQQRLAGAGLAQTEVSAALARPTRIDQDGPSVLSSAQRRMWYQAQLSEQSAAYNFCIILRAEDGASLSQAALTAALDKVVARHAILRTRYRSGPNGAPLQVVEPQLPPRFQKVTVTSAALDEELDALACKARDEAFDLETDSPLRVLVVEAEDRVNAVILTLPHIAGDGGSFGIVLADLERAYGQQGNVTRLAPPSAIRYTDYALWEQKRLGDASQASSLQARQLSFWRKQLANLPAEIPLPFDRERPAAPTFEGRQIRRWLGHGLSTALRETVKTQGGTPLTAFQAAVAVALNRVGAGHDIPLGTPVDMRQDSALDQLVGFFSNTVVVRIDLQGDPEFSGLLRRVQDTSLAALDHRDVPFENVVEELNPPRLAARNPLFTVMVTAAKPWPRLHLGDTAIIASEPTQTQAKFDLTFVLLDEGQGGRIGLSLLYASDLFDEDTATDLLELVTGILGQGMHHPRLRLSQLAEFDHRRLDASASALAGLLAQRNVAKTDSRRRIALKEGIGEAQIVAALSNLLERHDALRLRQDPKTGQWQLAETAALWERPLLVPSASDIEENGFGAVLLENSADDKGKPRRMLDIHAPGLWMDDVSWTSFLSDLADLNAEQAGETAPMARSYADWLARTAALGADARIPDDAERWLDMLDTAAETVAPLPADQGAEVTVSTVIDLSTVAVTPDPVALRNGALAALAWARQMPKEPLFIHIEEPDRDRLSGSGQESLVGWCRRDFPLLLTAPQEREESPTAEALRNRLPQAAAFPGFETVRGDLAASFMLARDVNAEVAGAFDGVALPDIGLSLTLGGGVEAETAARFDEGLREIWCLDIDVQRRRALLTLRASRTQDDLQTVAARFADALPVSLALVAEAAQPDEHQPLPDSEDSLIALTRWDLRRLQQATGPVREVLPLSPLQEGLRFHAMGLSGDAEDVYVSQTSLDLFGQIDADRFEEAVKTAIRLNPTLSAGFTEIGNAMVQFVPLDVDIPWRYAEVADEAEAEAIADQDYHAGFDTARPPLIRFALARIGAAGAEAHYRLLLTAHHILLDGWSIRLLLRLVLQLYAEPHRKIAAPSFRRYLQWLAGQDGAEAERVWREVLAGSEPTLLYPAARGLEASAERSGEISTTVDHRLADALTTLARSASTTISTVLELAWATLLMRLGGSSHVVFGNVVSGRPAEIDNVGEIIGLLFNTVPVRVEAEAKQTVRMALAALHAQKSVSLRYAHVQLTRLQQLAGHSPLFDTLFSVQNLPPFDPSSSGDLRPGKAGVRDATHYPLSMSVTPTTDRIDLRLMFRTDIVPEAQAEAILEAYAGILAAFLENADLPLMAVDGLPPESALLPKMISGKEMEISALSVADLLVRQAEKTPDLNAVTAGETRLSFQDLATSAHQLAHLMIGRGVAPEHKVALLLPRSHLMVVALFGVFAAHAAYVPIDPQTPANRIGSMLDQSQPTVILTTRELAGQLPEGYATDPRVVLMDDDGIIAELQRQSGALPDIPRSAGLDHLAYIIFTSGSTGTPKGVAVPYRGLTNMFINHQREIFAPVLAAQGGRRLKIAHTTSFAFDASWEQLLWLLSGHEVYVIDDDLRRDPERLLPLFDREDIDAFDVTPTYGSYLVEHGLLDRDRPQGRPGTGLVFMSLGGEAVGDALWTRMREAPGLGGYNLYGPTEYTINALGADLADSAQPSVGRPIANTTAHILGPGLQPMPVGSVGELYLSGVGLARGYVNRAAGTAERFVANPFGKPGERFYRTGDLARWRPDGSIDYLGRSDNQLKIRGYRIEPAEIENILVEQEGVKRAAVVARPDQNGAPRLIGYLVCDGRQADEEKLKDALRQQLPAYMIPAALVVVADLPRTINGKLDVQALPDPAPSEERVALPVNATEERVCEAFSSVLGRATIGRFDDFFEAGGHSLLTVRLAGLLRESLGQRVSVRDIYDNPTPAALAKLLGPLEDETAPEEAATQEEDALKARMLKDIELPANLLALAPSSGLANPSLAGVQDILLTGAAGFLGSFVLAELLEKTKARIHCLVRAENDAAALQRVGRALSAYGLWRDDVQERLIGVAGDLGLSGFGLDEERWNGLAGRIEVIIHNGGATNEFDDYGRLAPINVGGSREILRLAASGKGFIPVHFVSTASVVARKGDNPALIPETTRLTIEEIEETGYVQSKWVAEEMMHAAAARGLPVMVHRPGRVSGHSRTGACNTGAGFWHFIRAMLVLEAVPILRQSRLTLAPVDYVAKAMVGLIEHGKPGETYHLTNRSQTSIEAIAEAARRAGYRLESLPFKAWRERLAEKAEQRAVKGDDVLSSTLMLAEHLEKYDGAQAESALGQENVINALKTSGIAPPTVTPEMLDCYTRYFQKQNFFPPIGQNE
ncbi:non-ribosomal peptide synthetase [Rhizobium paknamense]|uniref:Amino acid adenylation domain-containing protein/thioester reductase-like protein n=1 Tax=Rhizobium paknamense TaxID=1206817 RepID=A0ABU0IKQ9_9HYPH|nr:non-ribosomal peptide synthetase [Rhizobium paknamense]MDQ0457779.1 amino acid adenylation domain-containing protein/thioester reductase-like protein [Rhizobium paknamense]